MQLLGTIVKLQVQTANLKVGEAPRRRYDPSGLRDVPILTITAEGVEGKLEDGTRLSDIHNRLHPESKNRGTNPISVGFTSHYDVMRRHFGEHLDDGIAGENILVHTVEPAHVVTAEEFLNGILIQTSACDRPVLGEVIVAAPCVEFSRFALRFPEDARPDRTVTDAVLFLGDGIRGFYARFDGTAVDLHHGDLVYAL